MFLCSCGLLDEQIRAAEKLVELVGDGDAVGGTAGVGFAELLARVIEDQGRCGKRPYRAFRGVGFRKSFPNPFECTSL